jgi:hypothetical protein
MDVENEDDNIIKCKNKNVNGNFILCKKNKIGNAIIPTNRFQIINRVAQYHLVDALSRSIDFKLQWQKSNQALIFGTRDNSFDDFYKEDNEMSTNNIEEINKSFNFTLNKLKLVESKGKSYYVLEIESHELEKLRLKYGLPKLLNGFKFHITAAIKEL